MYNWSRKVLSTSGGAFPRAGGGWLGPHRGLSSCSATHAAVLAATKVNGSRAGAQEIYTFYRFLVSFLFYMENRKIFMKRNAEFCEHSRKVIIFCLLVIILSC